MSDCSSASTSFGVQPFSYMFCASDLLFILTAYGVSVHEVPLCSLVVSSYFVYVYVDVSFLCVCCHGDVSSVFFEVFVCCFVECFEVCVEVYHFEYVWVFVFFFYDVYFLSW